MVRQESDLYYAVVEHVRSWLSEDGGFRAAIDDAEGRINGYQVRRISIIYNVSRGLTAGNGNGDQAANDLASLLNSYHGMWSNDLRDRAQQCAEIAEQAKRSGYTKGNQASAITKFSWFVRPSNWTVFDRFVANALKVNESTAIARMKQFYEVAHELNFLTHASVIGEVISGCQILNLSGARVLDKLLMLRGADDIWRMQTVSNCRNFLSILPKSLREDVKTMAREVQRKLDPDILIRR